jgi:perosamine synthetase
MNEVEMFVSAVKNQFAFLKQDTSFLESMIKSIPIEGLGFLAPVNYAHAENEDFIDLLGQSINIFLNSFSNQLNETSQSTKEWLSKDLLESDGNILFAIYENNGNLVGFVGFSDCINEYQNFKIDYLVKGREDAAQGIMSAATNSIIEWARITFNIETFNLSVTSDNECALKFFENNGFREVKQTAIKKKVSAEVTTFDESTINHADKYLVEMIYEDRRVVGDSLILTAGPSISQKESFYAYDAAKNGWNSQWSKYLTKFENTFAEFVGAKYAISTSSCTGALQIALMALDIGPGDEVIVPDETWVASANAIRYVGAIPIFADVEIDSWNIDATSIETVITDRTKAIIVVHMYGGPARMDKIMQIAERYSLKVVEDAAPAIGAKFDGKSCGTFGSFGAYSFQGAKLLVTGEGGMLVTDDEALYRKAHKIADQGRNPNKVFWIDEDGVKFKMSNVQAAIGLGQIERANELIAMKRRIFSWYERELADVEGITLNKEIENAYSIYWMSSIRLDESLSVTRDVLIQELKLRNVDSRPVFPAISKYPIWPKKQEPKKTADLLGRTAMNLPSGVCLTERQVVYICDQIKIILGEK